MEIRHRIEGLEALTEAIQTAAPCHRIDGLEALTEAIQTGRRTADSAGMRALQAGRAIERAGRYFFVGTIIAGAALLCAALLQASRK